MIPSIPSSPCPGAAFFSCQPGHPSSCPQGGKSMWGRERPQGLGLPLATAPAKMQRDKATAREGLQSASIRKGRSFNEGLRMQEETVRAAEGIGKGEFKAQGCRYILFFKGGFFRRIFIGNFSVAIDISLRDTSSLVKTSTS